MNILLLGDSIRHGAGKKEYCPGYGCLVKEKLQGIDNVFAPDDNCRFAEYTLRGLYDWSRMSDMKDKVIDVVHWNAGLWDALHLDGDDVLTPPDIYAYYIRRIMLKLKKLFPKAKIIFATSTPVLEERGNANFMRYNAEIREYNRIATEIVTELGGDIDDLYTVADKFNPSLHCDWVHYTPEGCSLLADAVIKSLKSF